MDAPPTQQDRTSEAPRKRRRRGRDFDGRTREALRLRKLHDAYLAQMPVGAPTASHQAQLKALALCTLRLESLAASAAQGAPTDDAQLVALANLQGRLMNALGIAPEPPEAEKPDPVAEHRRRMGWDK